MKLSVLSKQRQLLCTDLLKRLYSTTKSVRDDGCLVTESAGLTVDHRAVSLIKCFEDSNRDALTKSDAAYLVKSIDLSAVMLVDNVDHCWQAEALSLASFLRNQYFKCYGISAYDEI